MKPALLSSILLLTGLSALAHAQQGPRQRQDNAPVAPNPAAVLSESQITNVLSQLKELEKQVQQMRGSNLSSVLARLRSGLASDQAAMNLYLECDNIVNGERKDMAKAEARKRQDEMEKRMEQRSKNGPSKEEGDFAFAVRLGLQYLVLTLEAHETKDEDFKNMVPKLQEYINALVASASKLKGRASTYLTNSLSASNPIVDAFSLSRFVSRENWSNRPSDIGSMYQQTLLPIAKEHNPETLAAIWDSRIAKESAFKKDSLFSAEYELWGQQELPTLRWQRAVYLYQNSPSPVNALADMLKVIKEHPSHPDAPKWVEELRKLVSQAAPVASSSSSDSTAATPSPN